MLEKSQKVLKLGTVGGPLDDRTATFVCEGGDGTKSHALTMPAQDWGDMGRPELVTVTIEPGAVIGAKGRS